MALNTVTIVARSSSQLFSQLTSIPVNHSSVILFALSANAPDVDAIVPYLASRTSKAIGCLSAPFLPSLPDTSSHLFSLSLAFGNSNHLIPFRSTIPGRAASQVGRWHSFAKPLDRANELPPWLLQRPSGPVDWTRIWNEEVQGNEYELPQELQSLRAQNHEASAIIYFSDNAPQGLEKALSSFPTATQVGITSASTPFINGRPYTLLDGAESLSSGAVGVVLVGSPPSTRPKLSVNIPGLVPLTAPLVVTKADGNLIQELNNDNPSKLLVDAISRIESKGDKDQSFYLGIACDDERPEELYRILSGDPSRGTMSLDCTVAPPHGSLVQLFRQHRSKNHVCDKDALTPVRQKAASFRFQVNSSEHEQQSGNVDLETQDGVYPNVFLMGTDHAFTTRRRPGDRAVKCGIPGTTGTLEWSAKGT